MISLFKLDHRFHLTLVLNRVGRLNHETCALLGHETGLRALRVDINCSIMAEEDLIGRIDQLVFEKLLLALGFTDAMRSWTALAHWKVAFEKKRVFNQNHSDVSCMRTQRRWSSA